MRIRAVLFDLDNTLTDRTLSLCVFARQFAVDFSPLLDESQVDADLEAVIQQGDGGGYKPKETMFAEIQSLMRWRDSPPALEHIRDYWYQVSPGCMQLRPGAVETLRTLCNLGYSTGLITNGQTSVQNATIDATGIRDHLHTIIISESAGVRKPDAQIFKLALAQLQLDASECWFVGDHPAADVAGAKNAGLTPVWLEGCHRAPEDMSFAPLRIGAIPEVLDLLNASG